MKKGLPLAVLIATLSLQVGLTSCSKDDDKKPTTSENECKAVEVPKLVDKFWFRVGSNGKMWRIYKSDGTWESKGGETDTTDYDPKGTWRENSNTVNGVRYEPCLVNITFSGNKNGASSYMATSEKVISLSSDYLKLENYSGVVNEYKTTQ